METKAVITASRAWEVGGYRVTSRFSGSFLCEVGKELAQDEVKDLNQAFATGIYLNRDPEELLFHHETILVQIVAEENRRVLLVQLEKSEDPLGLAELPMIAEPR